VSFLIVVEARVSYHACISGSYHCTYKLLSIRVVF
jgi:hypothetical protein